MTESSKIREPWNKPNEEALANLLGLDALPQEIEDFPSQIQLPGPILEMSQALVQRTRVDYKERGVRFYNLNRQWEHGIVTRGRRVKFSTTNNSIEATTAPNNKILFHLIEGALKVQSYRNHGIVLDLHTHHDLPQDVLQAWIAHNQSQSENTEYNTTFDEASNFWNEVAAPTPSLPDVRGALMAQNAKNQPYSHMVVSSHGALLIVPNPSIEKSLSEREMDIKSRTLTVYEDIRFPFDMKDKDPVRSYQLALSILLSIIGDRGVLYAGHGPDFSVLQKIA